MAQKQTVYLIDGSSYIFRAYHAIRILSNSRGLPTNAIYGFTNMLLKFIKDYEPGYIGVVFDSKGDNFRNEIYPEYKANRGEPPEDLKPQFEEIFGLVQAFNIPMLLMEGYEADDVIGTLAKNFESKKFDVVIVTGDKDFAQTVSPSITLLDTMKNKATEIKDVIEKYGVAPDKMIELFALTGDSIDNIPGVKGIGPKTASSLIQKYGSVENIYNNLDKLKPRYKELLESSKEQALLSRQLVTIKSDIDMKVDLDEYEYTGFNKDKLIELFKKYEFATLLKEIEGDSKDSTDLEPQSHNDNNEIVVSYDNYKLVLNEQDLENIINEITKTKTLSIDLETTSQLPMDAEIIGIVLCPRPHESYYVPVGHRSLLDSKNQLALKYVAEKLKPIIENEDIKKIGQNLKYEYVVLSKYGIELKGIYFDTMIAAHLIDSSRTSYSLDELSKSYLGHKMISYKEVTTEGKLKLRFDEVEIETAKTYACEDADVAFLLSDILVEKLKQLDVLEVYQKFLLDLVVVLASIEISGVKVDTNKLGLLSKEFEKIINDTEEKVYRESGTKFNLNSTQQLREVLFDRLGLPSKKKTKKGEPSTDVEVLTDLSTDHIVPKLMLEYRGLTKLKSTYIDSLPKLINNKTGRIHTSFNQVGSSTGRISSSDPNLQNIPIRTSEGMKIREAFVCEQGYKILSADYSQIELRLLAHFSGDENLISAFNSGSDIHNRTAAEIFGVNEQDVTADMRRLAKNINFGIIYGISPFGLAKQIGTAVSQAKDYIDQYFSRYSKVKDYMDRSVRTAQEQGYAETLIGRRRYIPELQSTNRSMRGFAERAAINTPIQGSAADVINMAMINIHKELKNSFKSKMILQVHDELLFEVHQDEIAGFTDFVKSKMEGAWNLKVPLVVDISIGQSWADAH